jgi:hypothetical protein
MASYHTVNVSELTPGSVLITPVFDDQLFKLVDAGVTVDQYLIDRLQLLGITEVVIESSAESILSELENTEPAGDGDQSPRAVVRSVPLKHCSVCRTNIALETPAPDAKTSIWVCTSCGAVYFGRNDGDQERRGVFRVDPAAQNPFVAPAAPSIPPEYIKRLMKAHEADQFTGPDRRLQKRYDIAVSVVALPLGPDFRVIGEPLQMTTANVSLGGAALIHTRFVDASNLALDFTAAGIDLQIVLRVLHVRSLGLVYEVAGDFISQLTRSSV